MEYGSVVCTPYEAGLIDHLERIKRRLTGAKDLFHPHQCPTTYTFHSIESPPSWSMLSPQYDFFQGSEDELRRYDMFIIQCHEAVWGPLCAVVSEKVYFSREKNLISSPFS
ncbi:hypothetical protein J6590_048829 [Homalodisca vitripennis]|nr:hypothetical protein J6590_048829 [Homalodisca vitripennis]